MSEIKPNLFIANLIFVFHLIVVLFVVLAPFLQIPAVLFLHITLSISLLIHWYGNSNVCSLSMLESHFRGLNHTKTFTHQFIGPVYDISETEWSNICYIITIIALIFSMYYLYNSTQFKQSLKCINSLQFTNESFYEKCKIYLMCLRPIFSV
jgi:hypothetical protein